MARLDDFYPLILPEIDGATKPLVDQRVREAAIDMCRTTSIWRADFAPIDLIQGQSAYELMTPEPDSVVSKITSLSIGGRLIWSDDKTCKGQFARDKPPFSLSIDMQEITLSEEIAPVSSLPAGLQISAAMCPTATATTLPDFLLTVYGQTIRVGVLHRMMKMAGKPWSNPGLSVDYLREWNSAMNYAAVMGAQGNARNILRTKKVHVS